MAPTLRAPRPWRGAAGLLIGSLAVLPACTVPAGAPSPTSLSSSPAPSGGSGAGGEGAASGSPTAGGGRTTTSPAPTPTAGATPADDLGARCAALVERLTPEQRVGQLLMVAVRSTGPSDEEAAAVRRTRAGSVILLGGSTAGQRAVREVVAEVRGIADQPRGVDVLLAVDQEGGTVQRLAGQGFSDIPAASEQATLPTAELTRRARTWGGELEQAGIDADLAPVADVVPRELTGVNEPVARLQRGYGSSPSVVAEKVRAFTRGMDRAGIATAVKHFPGIGEVRGNTDFANRVVDTTTRRRDPSLAGFKAAVDAGADMVMVSSVVYTRIDRRQPAVFSTTVVEGMIRRDLGFDGVVVSDDLAAAALESFSAERRGVGFVRAGGDLAIVGDPAEAATMATALVEGAAADPELAARVRGSAARVLALKERRGLTRC